MFSDFQFAVRQFLKNPGFTITALLTFALCLGANVALFAVVNAVLVRPLPYPKPDQLVSLSDSYPGASVERAGVSVIHYLERRQGVAAFADAALFRNEGVTLGDGGAPQRVKSMTATPSFFHILGASAKIGRVFSEQDGIYGQDDVAILSEALWRQAYAADPAIIGRKIRLDGRHATVVGVMPADFAFGAAETQLWMPLRFSDAARAAATTRHDNGKSMIARLRPGTTVAEAQAQVDALNGRTLALDPYAKLARDAGFRTTVLDLHADFVRESKSVLLLLQAGVLFLLLIGAVNLANLLLVRASARTKEFSVRRALGAGRWQLARLLVLEAVVLSLAGGVLGLELAWAGLSGLKALGAEQLPHFTSDWLDVRVCLIALGASALTGLLISLPTLWHCLQGNLAQALAVESRGGTTTRSAQRLRHTLIVAQFALAFTLLTGAGLLGVSFAKVVAVSPGFQPENVLTGNLALPWAHYKESSQRYAFTERLGQELRAQPGVIAVGFTTSLPFGGNDDNSAIIVDGQLPVPGQSLLAHYKSGVAGDYFAALGIPLRAGRLLNADDSAASRPVCVVDENFTKHYWPGQSPLGHRIFYDAALKPEDAYTIVGVVGATKHADLVDQGAMGMIYLPFMRYAALQLTVVLRTTLAPSLTAAVVRAAVQRIDPELPVEKLETMTARIDDSLAARRSPLLLAGLFAGVALALAAVGIYGVLAYAVAQRRREIGLRMALGALPRQIRSQFLSLGARLVIVGSLLGAIGGGLTGRAMAGMLFNVGSVNLLVFAGVTAVLVLVALTACLLPAVRAARVPPMEALRAD